MPPASVPAGGPVRNAVTCSEPRQAPTSAGVELEHNVELAGDDHG